MKHVIKRIDPMRYGVMTGATLAIMGIFIAVLMLIFGGLFASAMGDLGGIGMGVMGIILFPILYGIMGFIFGVIGAFLYNLCAKWFGGVIIEMDNIGDHNNLDVT